MKTENLGVKRSLLWLCPGPLSGAAGRHSPPHCRLSHGCLCTHFSTPAFHAHFRGALRWESFFGFSRDSVLLLLQPCCWASILKSLFTWVCLFVFLLLPSPAITYIPQNLGQVLPQESLKKKILNEGNMTVSSHFVSNPTRR